MQVDTNQFSNLMFKWVSGYVELNDDEWVSIDGKAIQGSKQSEEDKQLAHMVSLFKNNSKEVLLSKQTQIKSNEIPLVQQIIEDLPLNNLIFTLDSLHCQSQKLDAIKDSGNDYVVCVKSNQKKIT